MARFAKTRFARDRSNVGILEKFRIADKIFRETRVTCRVAVLSHSDILANFGQGRYVSFFLDRSF